jgi:thiol-disulfide isomerase/thioredoxin
MSPIIVKVNSENDANKKDEEIVEYIEKGLPVFVLIYMEGCGPCMATRPEWEKIKDEHFSKQVVVADIDQAVLPKLEKLKEKITSKIGEIGGFPTMVSIINNGDKIQDYSGERKIDAFKEWIEFTITSSGGSKFVGGAKRKTKSKKSSKKSKRTKRHIRGGRKWSLKYKKSIHCNRPRGFSQRQYCKYGRK